MSFPLVALFLCCCRRTRIRDVKSAVIPNETSRLLASPRPAPVVDRQTLSERLAGIVRAKEEKMVSVSARAPFTIASAQPPPDSSSSATAAAAAAPTYSTTTISRRPPVLTMTPARVFSQGSNLHLNPCADTRSSSLAGSRASSQRRPRSAHSQTSVPASTSAASASGASGASVASAASELNRGKAAASASASGSDVSASASAPVDEEEVPSPSPSPSPSPARIPHPLPLPPANPHAHPHPLPPAHPHDREQAQGITFSWADV
ncbi:hypothetical protein DFH09DRAFT_1323280 [Mycena vulgaris]|nr:hypothetical protein DFH09DRAFT_1323280 [Mycena vulgaris]